ncbi:MAG: superoxide dismutase [Alphaproteobacteria bacterium]|nr:superoxide dismutase [Alphaproteobacteria bacterium]
MPIALDPLPWPRDALAPVVSAATIDLHYGKHHKGYVDTLNGLIAGAEFEGASLPEIVTRAKAEGATKIFNNAAQAWSHTLYWNSLSPARAPLSGALADLVAQTFGGVDALASRLVDAGMQRFGSGWVWLTTDGRSLDVLSTSNADTPMADDVTCLLTIDVWEHAYYVDYQNRRAEHLKAIVGLIDWPAAGACFERERRRAP